MKKSSAFVAIAASIVVVFALAGPASADPQSLEVLEHPTHLGKYADIPPGYAAQQWKADLVRAQALNKQYGLGAYALRRSAGYLTYGGSTESTGKAPVLPGYLTYSGSTEMPTVDAAELRGKALNKAYGNAWTRMSAQEFAALVNLFGNDVTQYSPQQLKTFVVQGERGATDAPPAGSGFGWSDAGIGAAAALGLLLIAGFVRRLRRTPTLATA